MMVPGETVEIAGQTFGPDCPKSTWDKPIELTARGNIVPGELFFWGVTHEHDVHSGILHHAHPAACSSFMRGTDASSSGFDPMASRLGARVPRLPCFFGDDPCSSSCVLGDCNSRPLRSPNSVSSRSSAPSDSLNSASLSNPLRKASSTPVSPAALFHKPPTLPVFAFPPSPIFTPP